MKYSIYFLLFLPCFFSLQGKTVYFLNDACYAHKKFFYNENCCRDEICKPYVVLRRELEKAGYTVKYSYDGKNLEEDFFALISINQINDTIVENISAYPRERCFLIATDPPLVLPKAYDEEYSAPFGRIYVMFDDLVDNERYFKFHYPQPRLKMLFPRKSFQKRKLCTLIAANRDYGYAEPPPDALYHERKDIIAFFESFDQKDFDLYGLYWDGYRDWKGFIHHKWPVLNRYRFSFCYENTKNQVGYITEKIFDSFVAGCVPIYKGADNINDYIPKNCYIDGNQFASVEEMYRYLKSVKKEEYNRYIRNIKIYLASPKAHLFSIDNFVKIIMQGLSEL